MEFIKTDSRFEPISNHCIISTSLKARSHDSTSLAWTTIKRVFWCVLGSCVVSLETVINSC